MRRNVKQTGQDLSELEFKVNYGNRNSNFTNSNNAAKHSTRIPYNQDQKQNIHHNTGTLFTHPAHSNPKSNVYLQYNTDYDQLIQQYYSCRKENYQLKNTIKELQAKLGILTQANKLKQSAITHTSASQYWDRIKYLQDEYNERKKNIYDHYQKQSQHLHNTVEYLVACYQQSLVTRNSWFEGVVAKIKQKGSVKALCEPHFVQEIIHLYQDKKKNQPANNNPHTKVNPGYCFDGQLGIGDCFDQKQSQVLRKRIKQLTQFIDSLIKLYRIQLSSLREQATGRSQEIMQEIKSCIMKNFRAVGEQKSKGVERGSKDYLSVSLNESETPARKKSGENKIKASNSQKKSKTGEADGQYKKFSLGKSRQISFISKPPLPTSISNKNNRIKQTGNSCNYSFSTTQCIEKERKGSQSKNANRTPKNGRVGGSAHKSKKKIRVHD